MEWRLKECLLLFAVLVASAKAEAAPRSEIIPGPIAGEVLEVLDGDTLFARMHIWIGQRLETSVRLRGIDTPERKSRCSLERDLAEAARQELLRIAGSKRITLHNIRLEKYAGRVLAEAKTSEGVDLAAHLLKKGLARPYNGKKRMPWCGNL
jgi:micrococcal nuclease